jgi:hypothetical protein
MSRRLDHAQLLACQEVVAPPSPRSCNDQTFELPPALYVATAALFMGFVTVLCVAFRSNMLVSWGVIAVFIAAFFAVPTIFALVSTGDSRRRALGWEEFMKNGVATATGRASGAEATVLVLLLPVLIFCFGLAVAAISLIVG